MGVMFLMYGFSTLVAVVYIRNALRHRGGAKPGRAKGRAGSGWMGAARGIIKAGTP